MIRQLTLALALIAVLASPAWAQERRVPASQAELQLSYAPLVKKVAPAVVNVYAAKVVRNRNPLFDDPIFRQFFGGSLPGGGTQIERSLGSGVVVDPSGLIVTNVHVIEGADEVKVALNDKREFEAQVVLKDTRSDVAVALPACARISRASSLARLRIASTPKRTNAAPQQYATMRFDWCAEWTPKPRLTP